MRVGVGEGEEGPATVLTPLPSFSSLLEPPELQHHVTWDLPGRGGGRGRLLPPHLMPSSCSAPCGSRPEAKENLFPAFGFFLLCFFLREVIFYSGFILKEKREQKSLCLDPQSLPCFLCICLKTPGLLHGAQGEDALIESSFCPAALASGSSQNPVIWCLRGRR